jgi:hypothetical protein
MGAFADRFTDFIFIQVVIAILQLIATAAVAVAIHRVILFGDRKPGHYFTFSFSRTELLYSFMAIVTVLITLAIMASIFVPVFYIVTHGDFAGFFAQFKNWPINAPSTLVGDQFSVLVPAYLIGWLVVVYFMLRLAVWPPAVVATNRFALGEAWSLTRGNVLRLFGMFLLTVITIWLVVVLAIASFWYNASRHGHMIPPMPDDATTMPSLPDPRAAPAAPGAIQLPSAPVAKEDPAAAREAARRLVDRELQAVMPYLPLIWLVELLVYIYGTAFSVALLSYSYKALKGYEAGVPIPTED